MVAEPWIIRMGSHVSTNLKHSSGKTKHDQKQTVGILSFEVANVMSKTLHLHRSLTHSEISKLKTQILNSDGVKNLISSDESYLLQLTVAEKLDDLNRVAGVVSRLGKKCSVPALQGFEHVYGDILRGAIDVKGLGFLVKDMDSMVRKMERYVNSTANLYSEMEVLNELEQGIKKFQQNQHEESRRVFEQKLVWKKQDVKHLQDVSLWNQTYDKVVELLARTICTIYARICLVFGDAVLIAQLGGKWGQIDEKRLFGMSSNRSRPVLNKGTGSNQSGTTERAKLGSGISQFRPQLRQHRAEVPIFRAEDFNFVCGIGPGRLFMECLSLSSSGSKLDEDEGIVVDDRSSHASACCSVASSVKRELPRAQSVLNGSQFSPKGRLALFAPPSTVGGSALALHYANVIIVIEKLLRYPHLVGEEARDDLYQMLPTSLRMSLKTSLKSYVKDLAIYDAPLAHDWKERLDEILRWLSPLAHNMIRWQTERNFEQHQIVTRTNVLLLQTIYFADRAKTEAAICELLVGLNYICRYEHQQNALLDCASSFDFDDCVDWQMQY